MAPMAPVVVHFGKLGVWDRGQPDFQASPTSGIGPVFPTSLIDLMRTPWSRT